MTERMTAAELNALMTAPAQKHAAGANSKRVFAHGLWFDSKKEAARWGDLLLLQRAGAITELRRQVPIELIGALGPILTPTGKTMTYRADYVYIEAGQTVVEDAKGFASPVYAMKKAILAAIGVTVKEV